MDELKYWRTILSLTDSNLSSEEQQCAFSGQQETQRMQQLQYGGCSAVDYIAMLSMRRDQAQNRPSNQSFPWSPMEMQARRAYERASATKQKKMERKKE